MIRLIISIAILIGAAGCASSPDAMPGADDVVATTSGDKATAPAEVIAGADDEESPIEVVEAPKVALTTPPGSQPRDDVVCRNEAVTGSHRIEEVCRLRSEIEHDRLETLQALRRLMRRAGTGR